MDTKSQNKVELCNLVNYSEEVEVFKEVPKKRGIKSLESYKVCKKILKLKNNRITLVSRWISETKLACNLCIKHIRMTTVTGNVHMIECQDRCRRLVDPLGNQIIIKFKPNDRAVLWDKRIASSTKIINEKYTLLSPETYVINETNVAVDARIMVISGKTTGGEIKSMTEEHFNMYGLLSIRHSLEIQCGKNIVPVIDDMSIFYLNEFLSADTRPMFCAPSCMHSVAPPKKPITLIVIDQANLQRKNFIPGKRFKRSKEGIDMMYNIEERWPRDSMPTWLLRLLSDIYFFGPNFQGVFRLSSVGYTSRSYYELMLTRDDFSIANDIYLKANVLKYFLVKIEGGILKLPNMKAVNTLIEDIATCEEFLSDDKKEGELLSILGNVPPQRLLFLQHLLVVVKAITSSDVTLMDAHNLGLLLSQAIFNNIEYINIEDSGHAFKLSMLTECIILLFDKLVDTAAEEHIVASFEQYKSEPCDIKYPESHTNDSNNSESYYSNSTLTSVDRVIDSKSKTDEDMRVSYESLNEDDEEDQENSFGRAACLSPRSRICMGARLFEKLNSSAASMPASVALPSDDDTRSEEFLEQEESVKDKESSQEREEEMVEADVRALARVLPPSSPPVTTRHASLLSSSVTPGVRQRRPLSDRKTPLGQATQLRRSSCRKPGHSNSESVKSVRSRSPYVKNMVEMYERQFKGEQDGAPSKAAKGGRKK